MGRLRAEAEERRAVEINLNDNKSTIVWCWPKILYYDLIFYALELAFHQNKSGEIKFDIIKLYDKKSL